MDRHYLFVMLAGILSGLIVFGGAVLSGLGFSAYEISFLSIIPSIVFLLPFVLLNRRLRLRRELLPLFILYGFVTAVILVTQFIPSLLGVPVALVVLLLYTQPIWTLIFTRLFLKEEITKVKLIAAFLVIIGVIVLVNPSSIDLRQNLAGIILALIAGIALSGWVVIGSLASKRHSHVITTNFYEMLFILLFASLSLPIVRLFVKEQSIVAFSLSQPWFLIAGGLLFGAVTHMMGHIAYFEGVKKVPTVDAGIIMLLEPVVGAILSAIFLNQPITIYIILGGALILLANYLVISASAKSQRKANS